jgi:serine/threonine-protein kinase
MLTEVRLPNGVWSYDPEKPLGKPGGFGKVFRGFSQQGDPVAVKRLHIAAAQAAHRELEIASELAGRNLQYVMPVLDAGQDSESDGYFVIMPVADESLQDRVDAHGPMSEVKAAAVLRQIATGLAEVPNIVHRDLKPANTLLFEDRWRVADFGIARFVEDSTSDRTLKDCLSPQYAAPEQWRGERATAATDVYALGCIAHTLLCGAPPEGTVTELQDKHLHAPPPEIHPCSSQMRNLLSWMLRKTLDTRPSLTRVMQILDQIQENTVASAPDTAYERLAAAAADHEKKQAEADAIRERARTVAQKRADVAAEARNILRRITNELAKGVRNSAPSATAEWRGTSLFVHVGEASLELDLEAGGSLLAEDAFPLSQWDVICGAIIKVIQSSPRHERAANLWYTKRSDRKADYRWYEVGYEWSPLTERASEFEPAAVTAELADRAHSTAMGVIQTAYQPTLIDDEDTETFCRRWADILAEACAGRLHGLPRHLPSL